jgi:hypothetical protein
MLETAPHLTAHLAAGPATDRIEADRRKLTRDDIAIETQMCDRANNTFDAHVINISNGGFMAQTSHPLRENDPVRIDLPTIGWVRADVVWVLGDRIGVRFRGQIEESVLAAFGAVSGR